jgi:hypothetical protein
VAAQERIAGDKECSVDAIPPTLALAEPGDDYNLPLCYLI